MSIVSLFTSLSPEAQRKLKRIPQPSWINPMLATLTNNYFSKSNFLYEHKWDGERILAFKTGSKIKLMTRNQNEATNAYPTIVQALQKQALTNFILDGEVIAIKNGISDFGLLQNRMHDNVTITQDKVILYYCLFDIMYLEQYDTTHLELLDRKALLHSLFKFTGPLRYTPHIIKNGEQYYHQACKKGWEGVIAKDIHSTYISMRSHSWLKFKCINQQEFVVGGYTEPKGSRINFGALLVGYYEKGKLHYAGKVGTGFTTHTLEVLGKKLFALEQKKSPFDTDTVDISSRGVHWVAPKLVAEIKFSEWTDYDKLRHPRYVGLREDKDPQEVIQEKAQDIS